MQNFLLEFNKKKTLNYATMTGQTSGRRNKPLIKFVLVSVPTEIIELVVVTLITIIGLKFEFNTIT